MQDDSRGLGLIVVAHGKGPTKYPFHVQLLHRERTIGRGSSLLPMTFKAMMNVHDTRWPSHVPLG